MQGLLGLLAEAIHLFVGDLHQILMLQCLGAQFKQLETEGILVGFPLLGDITQRLHGLQKAVDCALGHHDPLGQLGHPDLFLLPQCLQYAEHLEYR
ncbi:hypothetical protein D3C86_1718060 [compost metagenome]